ncbi:hypothetical protein ACTFIW_002089 [Dictyostelium discoideum]
MIPNLYLKIIILLLIINNVNSQIIDIYFSNSYGDLNGNGTISNPYQNLCLLNQILNSNNNNNDNNNINNSIIIINIDYGDYNLNCSSFLIINNFNNISFIPYKSNNNNNNNNNEIVNLNNLTTLKILNSNVKFDGLIKITITIIENETEILNSDILLNNGVTLYFIKNYQLTNSEFQCSNIKFSNSKFISNWSQNDVSIYFNSDSSLFEFQNSSIVENVFLKFNNIKNCSNSNNNNNNNKNEINFLTFNNSNIKDCYFTTSGHLNSIFDNSLLDGLRMNIGASSIVTILNSKLYAKPDSILGTFLITNVDQSTKPSVLNIVNSNIYHLQDSRYSLIMLFINSFVNISGCTIEGRETIVQTPIVLIGIPNRSGGNNNNQVILVLENSKISNLISPKDFINSFSSTVIINNVQFYSNSFSTIISSRGPTSFNLYNMIITCDQRNIFKSIIKMPSEENDLYSNLTSFIDFNNVYMGCVGGFEFQNSKIQISNFRLESFSKPSIFSLILNSELTIINATFISSIFDQSPSIFYINSSKLTVSQSQFKDSTNSILSLYGGSTATFQSTNFSSIITYERVPIFNSNSSSLFIENCNFFEIQTSVSSLFNCFDSDNLIIKNSIFERVGDIILDCFNTKLIIIDSINVSNCSSQTGLFYFSNNRNSNSNSSSSSSIITNSSFINNHGIGVTLFNIFESNFEISSTDLIDNTFLSIFDESFSNVTIKRIYVTGTTGIFYSALNSILILVDGLDFKDNYVNSVFTINQANNKIEFSNIAIYKNYFIDGVNVMMISLCTLEINNFNFMENVLIAPPKSEQTSGSGSGGSGSSGGGGGLIFQNSNVIFNDLQILKNEISVNLFNCINNTILSITGGLFQNNKVSSSFIFSEISVINLIGTHILQNQGDSSTLLMLYASNINVNYCEFSSNNLYQNGSGSILNFKRNFQTHDYYLGNFQIENSLFSFNIAKFGQLYFSGYPNDQDAFTNSNSTFSNNILISNHASSQGGAIFTENFIFSLNISNILNSNHFDNNTSLCGDNFSSSLKEIIFIETNDTFLVNGVGTIINYNAVDFYNNTLTTLSSPIQINITRLSNNEIQTYSEAILSGKGSFLHTFIGSLYERFKIELYLKPYYSNVYLTLGKCLPFQYMNNLTCEYCPIGSSYSNSIGQCLKCNPNAVTCVGSFVNVNTGYYMIDNEISMVERCANDMCLSNNQCQFKYSSGDLCFSCLDPDSSTPTFIAAKHGINCCSQFKLWLIVPLLLLYLVSALVLSVIKLNLFTEASIIGPIIVFLQINSVVFFSYNGIYILSFFRVSLDILNGICIFKGLNHGDKTLIILLIIIIMFLISSSDWFPLWLFRKLNSNFKLHNYLKRNLKKNRNLKKSSSTTQFNYFIRSRWQLFQIFIIPLLFNSFTLIIPKKIKDQTLLLVDFSILFNSWQSIIQIFISVLVLSLVVLVIIIKHFYYSNKKNQWNINLKQNGKTLSFKRILLVVKAICFIFFLGSWDFIIIIRSFLFSILSIALIFSDGNLFLPSIILIQIIYSIIQFLLNPFKKKVHNLINSIQLIIFLFADSSLFQPITPLAFGLMLTILIIISTFFIAIGNK